MKILNVISGKELLDAEELDALKGGSSSGNNLNNSTDCFCKGSGDNSNKQSGCHCENPDSDDKDKDQNKPPLP